MTRPTMFCESCESTVYADDVHSCYDAKAVREQQERERKLAALERAVVEAARFFVIAAELSDSDDAEYGALTDALTALDRFDTFGPSVSEVRDGE